MVIRNSVSYDYAFSIHLYERIKVVTCFGWQFIWALFLQKAGYGNNELLKKCSYEELNFICGNLPDVFSVEFTNNHPWKRKCWNHSFVSKAKSSNILSMPKTIGSIFGLPPLIDFITWKCRYNILWLPLLVPDTTALDNPLKKSI